MKIEDLVENVLNILCKSIEVFLKALLVFGFLAIGRYVVVESMDYFDITGWHSHDYDLALKTRPVKRYAF